MINEIRISEQDLDILYAVARGKTYKQAALVFGVGEQTIKNRMHRLLNLFGASHVAHLLAICIASDVIRVPELYQELSISVKSYEKYNHPIEVYHLASLRRDVLEGALNAQKSRGVRTPLPG